MGCGGTNFHEIPHGVNLCDQPCPVCLPFQSGATSFEQHTPRSPSFRRCPCRPGFPRRARRGPTLLGFHAGTDAAGAPAPARPLALDARAAILSCQATRGSMRLCADRWQQPTLVLRLGVNPPRSAVSRGLG